MRAIELDPDYGLGQTLLCPACRHHYLHHSRLNIVDKEESIYIYFWCEGCGNRDIELRIMQHKGNTSLFWTSLGKKQSQEEYGDFITELHSPQKPKFYIVKPRWLE